jgi:hypothetical protein
MYTVNQVNRTRVKEVKRNIDRLSKNTFRWYLVVALTLIDLRRREKTGRLGMCGTNGKKFPDIRKHMQQAIGDVYKEMDLNMDWWSVDLFVFFSKWKTVYFSGQEMMQVIVRHLFKLLIRLNQVMLV